MKKTLLSVAIASVLAAPALSAFAEDAPSPLTFNVGVVSDYIFRGMSQTLGDPALQGGIDYAFSNGFYVGAWASNVKWVKGWTGKGDTEIDLYGGYRGAINADWSYDVGAIAYTYPGHGNANIGLANPTTGEIYGSIAYKWLSAKYSHTVSSHFVGFYGGPAVDENTRGSNYLELNATYDLGEGWGVTGHLGHQKVEKSMDALGLYNASYSDWKVGVTKDIGYGVVGLAVSGTDAKGSCTSTPNISAYCFPSNYNSGTGTWSGPKDISKTTAVLSFLKTF